MLRGQLGSLRWVYVCTSLHTGLLYHCSAKSDVGIISSVTEIQPVLGKKPLILAYSYFRGILD